ncbi:MAG: hypothetical protein GX666_06425 [Tissierellia bacterium]|nr:hypothetical protein [Tissierellia bacterium]
MSNLKKNLIFVFDSNGIRRITFEDSLKLCIGKDPSIVNIVACNEEDSNILGYFQRQEDQLTYINVNDYLDTWINSIHLDANLGVNLRGNNHILLTKNQVKDDSDLASIFFTEDLERGNFPWKILNIKDHKENEIASKLDLGESYVSDDEIYIRHKNFIAYQKRVVEKNQGPTVRLYL